MAEKKTGTAEHQILLIRKEVSKAEGKVLSRTTLFDRQQTAQATDFFSS
jgi:hypothetical protein